MEERSQRFTKVERSWILYDWANSVYATIMMAALFPIYFTSLAGEAGDVWWGVGSIGSNLYHGIFIAGRRCCGGLPGAQKNRIQLIFYSRSGGHLLYGDHRKLAVDFRILCPLQHWFCRKQSVLRFIFDGCYDEGADG